MPQTPRASSASFSSNSDWFLYKDQLVEQIY